jgi:putative ATP-dependent endonuclease of OLD family
MRVYLAKLAISNFRKINNAELHFQSGLNVVVGANNAGKTAIVDALRSLLAGHDEPYPRLDWDDIHRPKTGTPSGEIVFKYVFRGLSPDDEADFMAALQPMKDGTLEAHITIRFSDPDKVGRLRVKRWCGENEDVGLTADMMENLRGVYLQPLRDASQSLRPSRNSQLSRLFQLLVDDDGKSDINEALKKLDEELRKQDPITKTHKAISGRHLEMLGPQLAQALDIGISASDFQRLAARLSLTVDLFDIEQNGLGFNNLIFMAVVLSELTKNPEASYRGLIIEEPEAHLHPQLQAVLLSYFETIKSVGGEKPVQLFVTSHSPNFASIAHLDSLTCLVDTGVSVETFFPRDITFAPGKREKLERYLDVTRAELFFARRAILVEGAAELVLVSVLAEKCDSKLREHGVSLISVEGLNFDSFLPLFGEKALKIPVSVLTDADPAGLVEEDECDTGSSESEEDDAADEDGGTSEPSGGDQPAKATKKKATPVYPALGDVVTLSANTKKMLLSEDSYLRVFHGLKTLEYDLALYENNRKCMLVALKELHPKIAKDLEQKLEVCTSDSDKARVLFRGMFERKNGNVQKGRFAQALAQIIAKDASFTVPDYIKSAVAHVCKPVQRGASE